MVFGLGQQLIGAGGEQSLDAGRRRRERFRLGEVKFDNLRAGKFGRRARNIARPDPHSLSRRHQTLDDFLADFSIGVADENGHWRCPLGALMEPS